MLQIKEKEQKMEISLGLQWEINPPVSEEVNYDENYLTIVASSSILKMGEEFNENVHLDDGIFVVYPKVTLNLRRLFPRRNLDEILVCRLRLLHQYSSKNIDSVLLVFDQIEDGGKPQDLNLSVSLRTFQLFVWEFIRAGVEIGRVLSK